MNMKKNKNLWDITNRPSTKTKLKILKKCFDAWLTIWNNQNWAANEWYIIDLFAGRGKYINREHDVIGSPLIFLQSLLEKEPELRNKQRKINLFLVEKHEKNYVELNKNVDEFKNTHRNIERIAAIEILNNDCNITIDKILKSIENTSKHPLFVLIDPTGIQIKKNTMEKIVALANPKDILFNYIDEGVRRTRGVVRKGFYGGKLNIKELKTIETLQEFIGTNINVIDSNCRQILEDYVNVFTSKGLHVVGYDMPYPDRNDILYYLLFASRKLSITNIVKDIYGRQKEKDVGPTLFGGKEFHKKTIFSAESGIQEIKRKSLLYQTKVEYGNWTINHIIGCKHGCKFPCYAMMMAKKFGWVNDYDDWRIPRIATNALDLLEKELPKYKNQIDFVHLCFMSDPFMYDMVKSDIVPQIKDLTLKIIKKLNVEKIKVTTLTKGLYPSEITDKTMYMPDNEYGITLVSLNDNFKKNFEPFSAPYDDRINALKRLAAKGLNTWVSMEPYPTPELDESAPQIDRLLGRISFVNKIIFGKLNYRRISQINGSDSRQWKNNDAFYKEMAQKVISFCTKHNIKYHIKYGTPLSNSKTVNIFKEGVE